MNKQVERSSGDVIVRVEQKHIDQGREEFHNPHRCPIALAFKDLFPESSVEVGVTTVTVGRRRFYTIPSWTYNDWVRRGVQGEAVEPIEFVAKEW